MVQTPARFVCQPRPSSACGVFFLLVSNPSLIAIKNNKLVHEVCYVLPKYFKVNHGFYLNITNVKFKNKR